MVDLAGVPLSIKDDQVQEAATRINSVLQSVSFQVEVFKSWIEVVADCDDLCDKAVQVSIVDSRFERRLLKVGKGLGGNGFVLFQSAFFKVP